MWVNHALIRYQQVTLPPANLTWYINQKPVSESHQSPLSRISSSSPNHLRINHFGNHCNPQAAPSQVTLYPVRNISRCALAKSEELIEVSSCLSKYLFVYRSIFLFIEVSSCLSKYLFVYRSIFLFIEVSSCLSKYLLVGRGEGEVVHQATVGLQHRVRRLGDIFTFDLGDSSQLF